MVQSDESVTMSADSGLSRRGRADRMASLAHVLFVDDMSIAYPVFKWQRNSKLPETMCC